MQKWYEQLLDDKSMVIIAVLIIAVFSMFMLKSAEQVITNIVTGLFGVAVGKSLQK